MKYEKPIARELNKLSSATGACASGNTVDQACRGGFSNVGPCEPGSTAGQGCTTGGSPSAFSPCTSGTGATDCTNGSFAGIY